MHVHFHGPDILRVQQTTNTPLVLEHTLYSLICSGRIQGIFSKYSHALQFSVGFVCFFVLPGTHHCWVEAACNEKFAQHFDTGSAVGIESQSLYFVLGLGRRRSKKLISQCILGEEGRVVRYLLI